MSLTALSTLVRTVNRLGVVAWLVGAAIGFVASSARAQAQLPTDFQDEALLTDLDSPVSFAFLPDGRVLLNELKSGKVRMVVGGAIATTDPVFTVDSLETGGEETGLLGIAIDPRWPSSPYVYLYYTAIGNTIRLARYTATGNLSDGNSGSLALDPASKRYLVRDVVSVNDNHNAGTLMFGPDSLLYASFGEDARACFAFSFDSHNLYGVIARMEVRNLPPTPGPFNLALLAPPDNPFPAHPTPQGRLVYAYGLRNPFRFAIDAPTGRMFIADVGWLTYEEVNVAAPGGGQNFGWPYFEGSQTYVTNECGPPPPPPGMIGPVFQYDRASYGAGAAAIIGGLVYRPATGSTLSFPAEYDGDYFFSEYYEGFIWRLHESGGVWSLAPAVPGQPNARDWARGYPEVVQWTRGADGSLYYLRLANDFTPGTGEFRRIVYRNPNLGVPPRPSASITFAAPYPSPARGATTLTYTLARAAPVRLAVHDAFGRRVRLLEDGANRDAGEHRLRWDGRDDAGRTVAPGVYLVRLVAADEVLDRRLILLR